ncbi:MAG: O-antigen ligase family protein [Ferruginibacter sp.]
MIREPGQTKLPAKNYVFLILTLIGILYTGGRAGLGGWALGFSLIVIFGNANLKLYATIVAIAMFVVIYNFKDSFSVFNRGENISDSYDFRMGIWRDAYNIFLNHPFFGIAPGNYANYVSVHNPDQFWFVENDFLYYDHPESGYLKFLTEYGAIGFVCILLLFIIPMINAFFSYLKWKDTTFLLLISAILSWMAGFYTVYSLGDVRIQIMVTAIICLMITAYKRFDLPDEERLRKKLKKRRNMQQHKVIGGIRSKLNSKLFQNSAWGVIANILQNVLLSVFFIVIAREYSKSDFANYVIANTVYSFVVGFSALGLGHWFIRELINTENKKELVDKFFKIQLYAGFVFYVINIITLL